MSRAKHYDFLKKLHAELSVSSGEYRSLIVDSQYHTFTCSVANIFKATKLEFSKRKIVPNAEQLAEIEKAAKTAYTTIKNEIKELKKVVNIDKSTYIQAQRLRFVFITKELVGAKNLKRWQLDPTVTFQRIKIVYKEALATYFKEIQRITNDAVRKKKNAKHKEASVGNFFHLGHLDKLGVSETQLRDGLAKTLGDLPKQEQNSINLMLKRQGINLSYERDDSRDMMFVRIESASDNLSRGGKAGLEKVALKKQIEAALRDMRFTKTGWANLKGSDSILERKSKQARSALIDPFIELKSSNLKVKGKVVKAKKSPKTKTTYKTQPKTTKGKAAINIGAIAKGTIRKREKSSSPASSPLQMIAMFNKQLPQVVAKNMVRPNLQYQTGRFAASVRVTEITKTPKGFPSIGYTYDKFPYQTFEVGYKQGSPEWDPRNLIAGSIREIAAQLAMGRFFTRRV
jgi:hypothetical protein|tara:strand:+ start:506 stop:1876 length:1371 start_codon:yes stop_codon:yes gene_type:complete